MFGSLNAGLDKPDPAALENLKRGISALGQTWPARMIADLAKAAMLPGRVASGEQAMPLPGLRREDFTDIPGPQAGGDGSTAVGRMLGVAPVENQPVDAVIPDAFNLAGGVMGGAYPAAQPGAVGIFGGRLAKTADLEALKKAEEMAAAGAYRSDIWDATGWFQGPDKKWRFEIDDSKAHTRGSAGEKMFNEFDNGRTGSARDARGLISNEANRLRGEVAAGRMSKEDAEAAYSAFRDQNRGPIDEGARLAELSTTLKDGPAPLQNTFSHQALYEAYPDLANVHSEIGANINSRGVYHAPRSINASPEAIRVGRDLGGAGSRSTMLHEIQHAIQQREGFARGGSPEQFLPDKRSAEASIDTVNNLLRDLARQMDATKDPAQRAALKAEYDKQMDYKMSQLVPRARVDPMDQYRNLAGEVEARTVQDRRNMTPEARQIVPPWFSQDVQDADQIVHFGSLSGQPQMATSLPMDEASRMARARDMGFDTSRTVYHGSPDARGLVENGFQTLKQRMGRDDPDAAFFFTDDRKVARSYADPQRAWDYQGSEPGVIPAYLKMENPKLIDWGGKRWSGTEAMIAEAKAAGHDGVIISNVVDDYMGEAKKPSTVRVVFKGNQIRRPDAAFDPAKKDSGNLLAGLGGLGVIGALYPGEDQ